MFDRIGALGLLMAAGGLLGTRFVFVVEPGHTVIIMNKFKGLQPKPYSEGMHFKIPFVWQPKVFEIRSRPRTFSAQTGTRDL